MTQRLLYQHFDGLVIEHITAGIDEPVLSMAGIGIKRDIGDDTQLRKSLLQRPDGCRGEAFRIEGLARIGGSETIVDHREQCDGRNSELHTPLRLLEQAVDGQAFHARHGRHRFTAILSIDNKYGKYEVIGRQAVLTHQPTRKIIVAHPAHPSTRELPQNMHGYRSYPAAWRESQLTD